ncbi:acid protease [Russula ochroleuca]|jgi:cathepsin E|uniref:Acid protease n=1 Tax=Russula ochroleuca TaxID=152965 RepID=A0A9P5MQS7_9AGAM|nr:acid protease [Russula ochroleuca]
MLLVAALAPFVLLATGVTAHPRVARNSQISLSITKHVNRTSNLALRDRKRSINLVNGCQRSTVEVPLNDAAFAYSANIWVGDPPTSYNLMIDTGSATTWLGRNKTYEKTKTSVETGNFFNITYNIGSVSGPEYNDTVTFASGVAIRQSIGVASNSSGFRPYDGILGIGPKDLTLGIFTPDNTSIIPTVTDNLYGQGKIEQNLVAVSFEPTTSPPVINGELTFGGTDSAKYTGDLNYFPITNATPADGFWAVDASLRYGDVTILNTSPGVVDTGSTLIGLATFAYNQYLGATGAVYDKNTSTLRITPAQYENLQSLFFDIGGRSYELTPNAQIWPRALNTQIGGETSSIYLVFFDLGPELSKELGFIAGMPFLERHYSVFDTDNRRVGLATTSFTHADIN